MGFDLSSIENLASASFNVRRQNGEELMIDGKPVVITMHGLGTPEQVAAEFKKTQASTQAQMAGLMGKLAPDAARETFDREAQYLAACTARIENWPADGGALGIYMNHKLGFITKQASDFLGNPANFMPSPTGT